MSEYTEFTPHRSFRANRGGHAPGHLRDAFVDWVEAGGNSATVTADDGRKCSLRWLVGQLWNCTDIMGSMLCADLDMRQGSTYARAVRRIDLEL